MLGFDWLGYPQLALVVVALALLKLYCRGGTCKVRRDLTGKIAVITGGNTGIGKETMIDLAKNGCTILIGARDRTKSQEAVKQAISETGNKNIEYLQLDLGNKQSVEEFARVVAGKYPTIDFLINNAGVMYVPEYTLTRDGFEMQMGINHLGHFYLTSLLWSSLSKSKDLRIINVSSLAHVLSPNMKKVKMDFEDFNSEKQYSAFMNYSKSKLANILFTKELARKVEKVNPNARVVCLHPGAVRTELMRYIRTGLFGLVYPLLHPFYWLFTKNPKEGAQTTLYTIYESADKLVNGAYYSDCAVKEPSGEASKKESQTRLWEISQKMLGREFVVS